MAVTHRQWNYIFQLTEEVFVQLSSLYNEKMEYRRFLFKVAADGDVRAQQELEREYHLRVRPTRPNAAQ